jgi:hypothetical protein
MTGPAQKGAEDAVWPGSDTINGLAGNAICSAISALAQDGEPDCSTAAAGDRGSD